MNIRLPLILVLCLGSCAALSAQEAVSIPLSERDTRAAARGILAELKKAYAGTTTFSGVIVRQALGPQEDIDGLSSTRITLNWNADGRVSMESLSAADLASAPAATPGSKTPLPVRKATYNGKGATLTTPDQKVYPLTIPPGANTAAVFEVLDRSIGSSTRVESLLAGGDPVQAFGAALRELRVAAPQWWDNVLCDVVVARFSESATTAKWTLTLLVGHDDHLLHASTLTGNGSDGRERLQIESLQGVRMNGTISGSVFRLPRVTEKARAEASPAMDSPVADKTGGVPTAPGIAAASPTAPERVRNMGRAR